MSAVLRAEEPGGKYLVTAQPPLVQHLDLLATAQGGVARMRELILTLAVQGKLVPQDPRDEPASVLLQKIHAGKERLIGEGRLTKASTKDEPLHLPDGWVLCKGRDLFTVIRGVTYQKVEARDTPTEKHLPILRANNIRRSIDLSDLVYVPASLVSSEQRLRIGDYVVCLASGSRNLVGKAARFQEAIECSFGAFCGVIRPILPTDYFSVYLASGLYRDAASIASSGIGINNLKSSSLLDLDIAVPPLAEQSRIVARVEELMKLCDALEAKQRLADERHARLTSTLFEALAVSESAHALGENWRRVTEHFDLLLDRPGAIDALESATVRLAIRGLLVHQDQRDGDGHNLLNVYRTALLANRRLELTPLARGDAPFSVPDTWAWARFGEVVDITGGVTLGRRVTIAQPLTLPYLRVANVQRGQLDLASEVKTLTIGSSELPRYRLERGDLLITEGGDWDKVGRTCIWRDEITPCLHQNHVFRARGRSHCWLPEWAEMYLNSTDACAYFAVSSKQTTNLASINMTQLRHCAFPVPPVSEQRRIVARVEELRRLCAGLRDHLTRTRETQSRLADALVAQATA